MTAFAFILGVLPLAIASGAGAVGRQIMGTAVIGGMLAASRHRDISHPGLVLRRRACFAPARGGTGASAAADSGDEVGTDMNQQATEHPGH